MRTARVGELAQQVRGVTYAKAEASAIPASGLVPILRAGNIREGRLDPSDLVYVPEARVNSAQHVKQNDVVIAASSGSIDVVGKAARVTDGSFHGGFGAFLKVLRPGSEVDPSYFAHFFQTSTYRKTVSRLAAGANINNLKNEHLDELEIPLPPIEEQRRIASILDAAQRPKLATIHSLELLKESRDSFVAWAVRTAPDVVLLGELLAAGPSNGLYKPASAYGRGTRIVRIDSFDEGRIDQRRLKRLELEPGELRRFGLEPQDIVINRVNAMCHVGKVALVGAVDEPMVYESNMMRIKVRDDWRPEFLAAWLMTKDARRQIEARAKQAVNQASINGRDVRALRVPLLSSSEQAVLVARLNHVDQLVQKQRQRLRFFQVLYGSLEDQAFSGRL